MNAKKKYQNLRMLKTGKVQMLIGSFYYGNYDLNEETIALRDARREKHGLPKAIDK